MIILSQDARRAVVFQNVTAIKTKEFTKVVQGNFILGKFKSDEEALRIVREIYNYQFGYYEVPKDI